MILFLVKLQGSILVPVKFQEVADFVFSQIVGF